MKVFLNGAFPVRLLLLGTLLVWLWSVGCHSNVLYEEKRDLPAQTGWRYADTLLYTFEVQDTSVLYDLFLDLDYQRSFRTQNVYLRLTTIFPDGKRVEKVKSFDLFDGLGKPNAQCGGDNCHGRAVLQEKAYFAQPGRYGLLLEQYMRADSLAGIQQVGLTVLKTAEKKPVQTKKM